MVQHHRKDCANCILGCLTSVLVSDHLHPSLLLYQLYELRGLPAFMEHVPEERRLPVLGDLPRG
eukprot:12846959-Prorocentrum_lima.AAC.1